VLFCGFVYVRRDAFVELYAGVGQRKVAADMTVSIRGKFASNLFQSNQILYDLAKYNAILKPCSKPTELRKLRGMLSTRFERATLA